MKVQPLEFEKPIVELEKQLDELKKHSKLSSVDLDREVRAMEIKIEETKREIYEKLTAWQKVQIARHTARPFALDYLNLAFSDFLELHGDRLFGDDEAMPCGFATIGEHRCAVVAHQKGRDTKVIERRSASCGSPKNFVCPCSR
jgi:acetyl-CoA carboxylase carboxyl transferase subunit alpha